MEPPAPNEWLVLDMDEGVLRREPTRRAALKWFMDYSLADRVRERYTYGPGSYDYVVGNSDPYDVNDCAIAQVKMAGFSGWQVDQVPLYPLADQPFSRVERPDGETEDGD